ncbi:MAG: hypothetical protein RR394_04595, partial [Oscillospiraceae bacterium]
MGRNKGNVLFPASLPVWSKMLSVVAVAVILSTTVMFSVGAFNLGKPEEKQNPEADDPEVAELEAQVTENDTNAAISMMVDIDGQKYENGAQINMAIGDTRTILNVYNNDEKLDISEVELKFDGTSISCNDKTVTAVSEGESFLRVKHNSISMYIRIIVDKPTPKPANEKPPESTKPKPTPKPTPTPTP